jgi:hypothetical protein
MTYTVHQTQIRTLKSGDPKFHIQDKFVTAPRAGFEINKDCPREYKGIILQCLNNGWLKPIANVTERELLFMGLSKE